MKKNCSIKWNLYSNYFFKIILLKNNKKTFYKHKIYEKKILKKYFKKFKSF